MDTYAIIGGGLSGTLSAIRILTETAEPVTIYMFEKSSRQLHRGAAYSSKLDHQLLNVPANKMSLYIEEPDQFSRWLTQNGYNYKADDFVPRSLFGNYVDDEFQKALQSSSRHKVITKNDEVIQIKRNPNGSFEISSKGETSPLVFDTVYLCTGNIPPSYVKFNTGSNGYLQRVISNPWIGERLEQINKYEHALIIGSGLTMIDQVLSLHKKGHSGKITVMSRRGHVPKTHASAQSYCFSMVPEFPNTSITEIVKWIRKEIEIANKQGIGWRSVLNALRDYTPKIWQSLTYKDKKSFLEHLKPIWETHRHRVPAESMKVVRDLECEGQLDIVAARITGIDVIDKKMRVSYKPRGSNTVNVQFFDWVINCTGPQKITSNDSPPLISSMLKSELVQTDRFGLGLLVNDKSEAINGKDEAVPGLFVIGPTGKGSYWECTALREIRQQTYQTGNAFSTTNTQEIVVK